MKADKTSAVPLVGKWHQGPIGNCFIHQNIQTFVTSSVFFVFHMECKSPHTGVILLRKPVSTGEPPIGYKWTTRTVVLLPTQSSRPTVGASFIRMTSSNVSMEWPSVCLSRDPELYMMAQLVPLLLFLDSSFAVFSAVMQ